MYGLEINFQFFGDFSLVVVLVSFFVAFFVNQPCGNMLKLTIYCLYQIFLVYMTFVYQVFWLGHDMSLNLMNGEEKRKITCSLFHRHVTMHQHVKIFEKVTKIAQDLFSVILCTSTSFTVRCSVSRSILSPPLFLKQTCLS